MLVNANKEVKLSFLYFYVFFHFVDTRRHASFTVCSSHVPERAGLHFEQGFFISFGKGLMIRYKNCISKHNSFMELSD